METMWRIANSVAMHYTKILVSLKTKNGISLTPRNCDLNAFTFALNGSSVAFDFILRTPEHGKV